MGGRYIFVHINMERKMAKDIFGNYTNHVIEIDWAKVECSGSDDSHPKVYYRLKVNETKSCEYCGLTWKRIPKHL